MHELDALADGLVRPGQRTGVALGFVDVRGEVDTAVQPGRLKFDEGTFFEIGSLAKTMTATLLALLVLDGTVSLDTTVGDALGSRAGPAEGVSFEELATHTSGIPRILQSSSRIVRYPRDPYKGYGARQLLADLCGADLSNRGTPCYSNAGFDLLGYCLEVAAGAPFRDLLEERVLRPAGMTTARCQPCTSRGLARGHGSRIIGGRRWHTPLAGSGGVDATIGDAVAWTRANLHPSSTPLEAAIRMAQEPRTRFSEKLEIGLAWLARDDTRFHNGGTGRFTTIMLLDPTVGGLVLLENQGPLLKRAKRSSDVAVNDWFIARLRPPPPAPL